MQRDAVAAAKRHRGETKAKRARPASDA